MMDNDRTQPRRRLRLAPAQRVPQILDAALQEFSRRGFTAARMDDIAQRCGLSKGGLYAHFDSKDAIFKALLDRSLNRTDWAQMPQLAAVADTRAVAEWTVDRLHAALLAPEVITLLRLLIPERERVPLRVDEWKKLTQQHTQQVMAVIHHNLEASGRKDTVLARHPWLVLSPSCMCCCGIPCLAKVQNPIRTTARRISTCCASYWPDGCCGSVPVKVFPVCKKLPHPPRRGNSFTLTTLRLPCFSPIPRPVTSPRPLPSWSKACAMARRFRPCWA